jgi:ABC-type phosphate/phosphonate transport system ATPase subunit
MGLQKDIEISELYELKNRFNSYTNRHYPWENDLLKKTTTSYIWKNYNMNEYLTKIQSILVFMLEQMNFARNFFNFTVHKYYNDHWG